MDWVEVPPNEWRTFLGRFTDEHRGWQAAIERCEPGHIPERLIEGMPLQLITAESAGAEVQDIAIIAGDGVDAVRHLLHRVWRPRHVRHARSPYWSDASVHIDTAGGPTTVLHVWTNTAREP